MAFEYMWQLLDKELTLYSIILVMVFIALIYGSISDILTRELSDVLTYGMIIAGLMLRLIFSVAESDWSFILAGLLGLGVCFAIGSGLYYSRVWGGGDAKLLIGLGAIFGMELSVNTFMLSFMVNMLIAGAIYGLAYAAWLYFNNQDRISIFETKGQANMLFISVLLLLGIFTITAPAWMKMSAVVLLGIVLVLLLTRLVKKVEDVCMTKRTRVSELKEGDWLKDDIYADGKYICGKKDLGIDAEQIQAMEKAKIKSVKIKLGIPYVPVFMVGFMLTLAFGNWYGVF